MSPSFYTPESAAIFSLGQATLQMHNCCTSISSSHRHLIFWLICDARDLLPLLPLPWMTSASLLLIKRCEKKPSGKCEQKMQLSITVMCALFPTRWFHGMQHTTADLIVCSVRECKAWEQSPEDEACAGGLRGSSAGCLGSRGAYIMSLKLCRGLCCFASANKK